MQNAGDFDRKIKSLTERHGTQEDMTPEQDSELQRGPEMTSKV
jgi:hypothetical protein